VSRIEVYGEGFIREVLCSVLLQGGRSIVRRFKDGVVLLDPSLLMRGYLDRVSGMLEAGMLPGSGKPGDP
jgi:hypothetical protein